MSEKAKESAIKECIFMVLLACLAWPPSDIDLEIEPEADKLKSKWES